MKLHSQPLYTNVHPYLDTYINAIIFTRCLQSLVMVVMMMSVYFHLYYENDERKYFFMIMAKFVNTKCNIGETNEISDLFHVQLFKFTKSRGCKSLTDFKRILTFIFREDLIRYIDTDGFKLLQQKLCEGYQSTVCIKLY